MANVGVHSCISALASSTSSELLYSVTMLVRFLAILLLSISDWSGYRDRLKIAIAQPKTRRNLLVELLEVM